MSVWSAARRAGKRQDDSRRVVLGLGAVVWCSSLVIAGLAQAQTGVSEDRVSLPEGPGSLEGLGENIDVNANMGAMTYGIQVDLPKGYPEMTPAVGLTYNSGGGNTLLGVGWDMSTPFIERMTSRGLPRYDDTDLFAANGGLQLVQISGAEPAVYRARFEGGFVRFKWHDRGRGDGGRWTAELPDGRVEHYGADARGVETASARVGGDEGVFRYHLVEVVDVWGHAIRYSYRKLGTATVPVQIGYVFVEDQPRFKVEFDYEDRPDLIADLKGGFPEVLESRLSRVRVISSGVEIGRWALSYEPAQLSGGASRLAGVERFGLGLERYPAAFRFGYSRSIGGLCEGQGCERPTLVSMGRNLGINFRSGNVTLIDINGDALPDIVETPVGGAHRFLINRLTSGRQYFDDPIRSQVGQTSTHALSAGNVQVLDVDGDGFADLINTRTGEVLENKGAGDWVRRFNLFDGEGGLPDLGADLDPEDGDLASIRFFDFDNDKRIDVLKSSGQGGDNQTSIFRNLPSGGFEAVEDIESLQVGFESDQLQMSDFNGDGLLDLVQMSFDQVRVRLNRGLGRWTGWSELDDLPFSPTELLQVEMEDLNNDGLSDMVLVLPDEVRYALNVNGAGFGQPVTMNSASLGAELPPRDDTTTVLFADMNGNGSSDIVWITINGDVTFLEMFSVQPNLLSHIDNSLGFVQEITYGSSVQQAARDAEAGRPWSSKLPHAVSVVTRISTVEGFANLTDASTYEYTEGFYDGAEKAFRGFERVAISSPGGDGDEISVKRLRFDQGRSGPHRAGLELEVSHEGDAGRLLRIERRLFEDCPLEGLPPEPSLSFPIRFVCMTRSETVAVEDNPASLWATATAQFTYDGFGNVTREALLGLTDIGGEGCEPCQRDPSIQGRACGPQCLGDEQFSETEYVHPDNTGGRWILGAPSRVRNHGGSLDDLFAERTFYYDGDAFEGLPLGQLSHGALTRVSQRVDDQGGVIQTLRFRRDRHGNVLDELNPKGDPAQLQTERRAMTWDLLGLNPIQAEQHLLDDQGAPYSLRQRIDHDLLWNKPSLVSNWVVIQADRPTTPETFEAVLYDNFGRFSERFLAGDDTGDPSERLTYELASPISRVVFASRVEHGRGALDKISIRCFDGKGRKIQERTQLDDDRWLVSHYTVFNANGSVRRLYTAHVSPSGDCAAAPPEGTGYREVSYDALGRDLRHTWVTREGAASERYVHGPTTTLHFDMEDNDPSSPHFDTPTRHDYDGLGRIVGLARFTTPTEAILTEMTYDALGNFRGTLDPQGNEKIQTYDEAGRLVHIQDPDRGQTRLTLDANGQVIEEVDGAGRVIGRSYDGMGRLTARWDAADPEGTRIEHRYDFPRDCPAERCTNTAHKIVEATFPDGQGRGAEWYGYNARQQMVFEGVTVRQRTFEFLYDYDNLDRVTRRTFPDNTSIDYTWDNVRLTAISGVIDAFVYGDNGLLEEIRYANGVREARRYDGRLRLSEQVTSGPGGADLMRRGYGYDKVGNVLEVQDNLPGPAGVSAEARYRYDPLGRLVEAHLDPGREGFDELLAMEVDDIDNIVSKVSSRGEQSAAHVGRYAYGGAQPHAVTRAGAMGMVYDGAGQMVQRGGQALTWDAFGRLEAVTEGGRELLRNTYGVGLERILKEHDGQIGRAHV